MVQEGTAPNRDLLVAAGVEIGLDIGPSTIAIVSEQKVGLEAFASSVIQPWAEIRRLQRKLDRSRCACNPDNYHANGTIKKGNKVWNKSSRYQQHHYQKKPLSHAFLALNVSGEQHNPHQLQQSWSAVEPLLRRTGLCINQSAKGKAPSFPTVLLPSERIVRHSAFGTGQGVSLETV